MKARDAGDEHPVIRHGRLAEKHAAGFAHARDRWRILHARAHVAAGGAERCGMAGDCDVVLDGDRDAVERAERHAGAPPRLRRRRLRERILRGDDVHRVELAFPGVDAGEAGVRHFDGRELAGAIGLRQRLGGEVMQRGHAISPRGLPAERFSPAIGFWSAGRSWRWQAANCPGASCCNCGSTERQRSNT